MAAIAALKNYGSDDSDQDDVTTAEPVDTEDRRGYPLFTNPSTSTTGGDPFRTIMAVNSAPDVVTKEEIGGFQSIDYSSKELAYNAKFEQLFAPSLGPQNPYKTGQHQAPKNTPSGFVEPAEVNAFQFETQRKTYHSYGYAYDPSTRDHEAVNKIIGDAKAAEESNMKTVFESVKSRPADKRKRTRNWNPEDIDNYTGPWGGFEDLQTVSKPEGEVAEYMEEYLRKRKKLAKKVEDRTMEEKTVLHIKDPYDYQGRSFLQAPHDIEGVKLYSDFAPEKCFVPKKLIHTWPGHCKGTEPGTFAIQWFPKTAHLLLSCGIDGRVKLWEVYKQRRLVRSYWGHKNIVRSICFNNDGTQFLSCSYDRFIKLWDTETGKCIERFTQNVTPYVVKFNPDEDKQNLFLSGMNNKKILQWDTRSNSEVVQEYDRHLGAVNTITFFDQNRRFCTTSDDKSMRIWEWGIPVDTKLIQEPSLHSMPFMAKSPNEKWIVGQSMDNKILVFQVVAEKLRWLRRKAFKGHINAGYACGMDFSPDMSYLASGCAEGKVTIWDFKTHKIVARWKAHDGKDINGGMHDCATMGLLWHPHETSKIVSASWDGSIKLWD